MRPSFRILADGADITAKIADRLVRLVVTDEAGSRSDAVEIAIDDRDQIVALPPKGAKLRVWLGFKTPAFMGEYVVDELTVSGGPASLVIRAKAADMRAKLKAPKTRSWDVTTLGDVVKTIAGEHALTPRVAEELAAIDLGHVDQTEESDLHLLTRLARQYDAVAKPAGGMLLMVGRGKAKTASGRSLSPITLSAGDFTEWQATLADRGRYASVVATWHSTGDAQPKEITIGAGEPAYRIREPYPTEAAARAGAEAKYRDFQRGTGTFTGTLAIGNPLVAAEVPMTLAGVRSGIDGAWTIARASHRLDASGYVTEVEAEVKG